MNLQKFFTIFCQNLKNPYNTAMQQITDKILFALSENKNITDKEQFHRLKNEILAEYKIPT